MSEKRKRTAVEASRGTTFRLPPEGLKAIDDDKHPLYDPRVKLPVSEGLVTSIMVVGFKSVLKVWKDGEALYVIDGIQRWKAAIEANRRLTKDGKETVEVEFQIERGQDNDVFGVAAALNENRHDDDPVEKAKRAKRLLDMGKSEDYVAAIYGWTRPQFRLHVSLLDLARPVQDAIGSGRIQVSAAGLLAKLPRDEQKAKLEELLAEGGKATFQRTKKAVRGGKSAGNGVSWRPRSEIKKVAERMRGVELRSETVRTFGSFIGWILGEIETEELLRSFPGCKPFVEDKE